MSELSAKERIIRQARGVEVDKIPALGGWIGGVRNLAALADISVQSYLADPLAGMVRAHKALGCEGLINPVIHRDIEQVRTGHVLDEAFVEVEPEALVQRAAALPDGEKEVLASFDATEAEQHYRSYFETALARWDGLVPVPNFWEIGGPFPLYTEYGYNAFLMACALYPQAVEKIWWARSLAARERAKIMVKLYAEYELVPLMFCGEDLCNNQGPMVSPDFLRAHYLPLVAMIIEPLVDSGIRLVHHCDGDVLPLLQDFIEIGFSGLQGFQYELGVDLYELRKLRSSLGEELLIFAGLSVSRTLPFGQIQDVRDEVDYFFDATDGGRGLFFFTSNVTGIEVPPENLQAAYGRIKELEFAQQRAAAWTQWPWQVKEGV
jgi:hypothetical protein